MNSELFGQFCRFVRVKLLDRHIEVPENNTLLRGLQFASPTAVAMGRFCWNGDCSNCQVTIHNGHCESKELACRLNASDGLHVTGVSPEIRRTIP